MPDKKLFDAGLKNRREVLGEAYVERALQNGSSEFAFAGQQLITEYDPLLSFSPYMLSCVF